MDAFLILPIQRIPRYNLLLSDLVKHTWADRSDYENLRQSLSKMQEVVYYINERKRESENINKILENQGKLTGKYESLIDSQRRLVREGDFTVVEEHDHNTTKERVFFLFNDKLLITKFSAGSILPGFLGRETLKVEHDFSMSHLDLISDSENPTTLIMTNAKEQKMLKITCGTNEERDLWLSDFIKTKDEYTKNKERIKEIAMKRSQDRSQEAKSSLMEQYRDLKGNRHGTFSVSSKAYLKGKSLEKYKPDDILSLSQSNDEATESTDRDSSSSLPIVGSFTAESESKSQSFIELSPKPGKKDPKGNSWGKNKIGSSFNQLFNKKSSTFRQTNPGDLQ